MPDKDASAITPSSTYTEPTATVIPPTQPTTAVSVLTPEKEDPSKNENDKEKEKVRKEKRASFLRGKKPAKSIELPVSHPSRPVLVEFQNIVKSYGDHLVLDHVSLKLFKGEFLSVVGPSGAGKSTLIKTLTLQEWPDEGRIIVAGRDITLLRPRELPYYRRKVGIVFQDFKLLASKTVYENVAFALEVSNTPIREIKERVQIILETVGMYNKKDNFPHELSGGEQQRAAIARALVHDPKILIADEPTGNLDPVNTWEIIDLLFKINKSGTMVILATHDREIVDALKKRVITIRSGSVVSDQEKGTYIL